MGIPVTPNRSLPDWLQQWLKIPFYEEKCKKHNNKYNTVFCGVCMGEPVCEHCWDSYESTKKHHDHNHLRVCRASERAAIETRQIMKFCDISEIQLYSINSKGIVHLNPSPKGKTQESKKGSIISKCETCKKKLKDGYSEYRFCCIACKYKSKEGVTCNYKENVNPQIIIQATQENVNSEINIQSATHKRKISTRVIKSGSAMRKKQKISATEIEGCETSAAKISTTEIGRCESTMRKKPRKGVHRHPQRAPLK